MQSLQADSTLVFPTNDVPPAEEQGGPYGRSPLKASVEMPLPVLQNEAVDLRLDSESNYVDQEQQWRQQQDMVYASEPAEPLVKLPSRNPSVASSVATFNVEELYERNAGKLKMLEDLDAV